MEVMNVLIVEDKKEDALLLEKIISAQGYKVWTVTGGADAFKLVKNTEFSAVISELHMSGMNGVEITEQMQQISPRTSVVVMTVYSFIDSAVEAMKAGAYGYVTKPFKPEEIKIVLKRAVERYSLLSVNKDREKFAELSVKDGLTGVYNRRFLNVYLNNKISMVKNLIDRFSVLILDLDHFKDYNDSHGHVAGDELLKKVSQVFQDSVRNGDSVFRYGGEEFLILLDHADKKNASLVAERIRNLVSLYTQITISIGVGSYPEDGDSFEKLIVNADTALYKAKEGGRNKVCVFGA